MIVKINTVPQKELLFSRSSSHVIPYNTVEERVDKLVIATVPFSKSDNMDSVWNDRKADVVKHSLPFKYDDEAPTEPQTAPPSEPPSGYVSVAQTPAAPAPVPQLTNVTVEPVIPNVENRLADSESGLYVSASEIPVDKQPAISNDGVKPVDSGELKELKELKEKYNTILAERNNLQAQVTTQKGQIAKLQADLEAQQKKIDASTDEDRADRRSWTMFIASLITLLAVIIYSFSRPSSSSKSEL